MVPTNEVELYRPLGMPILAIPPEVTGISALRNWIIPRFPEEVVIIYDDDLIRCLTVCSMRQRTLSPEEIEAMVENTAYCAKGAGARVFGWNQRPDPRVLQKNDPFHTTMWVGGAIGIIGKDVVWDRLLKFKCDIDRCLTELLETRIVWQERRFCFKQHRDKNMGGNSLFRSPEKIESEKRYLKGKWKAHVELSACATQDLVKIIVTRKQKVDLPAQK